MSKSQQSNIAHYLPAVAAQFPCKRAVVVPEARPRAGRVAYSHLTFRQLNRNSDRLAWGLCELGVKPGTRVLLMVRPGLDFFAVTFAIFKAGAIPVLIDPGMGWCSFMRCVAQAEPECFIGIPAAHVMRLLFRRHFRSVTIPITLGRRLGWGGSTLDGLPTRDETFPVTPVDDDDLAAILFTTGSTGPAKGVQYTHGVFCTQTEILRRQYRITPDDVDLPCFPLFALFSTALGVTAVVPDMDPTRPASVNPERIVEAVNDQGVTYSFGSPTLWHRVSRYCVDRGIRLDSLRRVLMAGAPVPDYVHQRLLHSVLAEGGETHTPYGATESLPVTDFTGTEMLEQTAQRTREGAGMCVGRPIIDVTVRVINVHDDPIPAWRQSLTVPDGEVGEIVAQGPVVTRRYDHLPDATRLAKIADGKSFWHRMGDVGYFDPQGRLWFCGRKNHRVVTDEGVMYTVCCEAIFNEHPRVYRSALVGIGADRCRQTPVIVIEPMPGCRPRNPADQQAFTDELLDIGAGTELTRPIRTVLFHRSFPVDIRHNAKIRREALAVWAAKQLR